MIMALKFWLIIYVVAENGGLVDEQSIENFIVELDPNEIDYQRFTIYIAAHRIAAV